MYKLITEREIDAAHFLPNYVGKCANMHGHRWKIKVEICTELLTEQGFVIDFTAVKNAIDKYDHKTINDFMAEEPPTAENIAAKIYCDLSDALIELGTQGWVEKITVWETEKNCIEYTGEA